MGTDTHVQPQINYRDGPGKYKLLAFVSHIGHYFAHVRKDSRWVIFNDFQVTLSEDPRKDMGYLYFFQFVPSIES